MKSIRCMALVVLVALASGGCLMGRSPRSVQTHPVLPVSTIETLDSRLNYYLLYAEKKDTHQFWTCTETDSTLECYRSCGGSNDIKCPEFSTIYTSQGNAAGSSSNVR